MQKHVCSKMDYFYNVITVEELEVNHVRMEHVVTQITEKIGCIIN